MRRLTLYPPLPPAPGNRTPIPRDVPVERGSVGAMSLTMGSQTTITQYDKPYVWGLSDPAMRPIVYETPEPEPEPKPKSVPRPRVLSDDDRDLLRKNQRRVDRQKWERQLKRQQEEAALRRELLLSVVPYPKPETEAVEQAREVARNVRASPGWSPLTGADIDDLLQEVGLTDSGTARRGVRGGAA